MADAIIKANIKSKQNNMGNIDYFLIKYFKQNFVFFKKLLNIFSVEHQEIILKIIFYNKKLYLNKLDIVINQNEQLYFLFLLLLLLNHQGENNEEKIFLDNYIYDYLITFDFYIIFKNFNFELTKLFFKDIFLDILINTNFKNIKSIDYFVINLVKYSKLINNNVLYNLYYKDKNLLFMLFKLTKFSLLAKIISFDDIIKIDESLLNENDLSFINKKEYTLASYILNIEIDSDKHINYIFLSKLLSYILNNKSNLNYESIELLFLTLNKINNHIMELIKNNSEHLYDINFVLNSLVFIQENNANKYITIGDSLIKFKNLIINIQKIFAEFYDNEYQIILDKTFKIFSIEQEEIFSYKIRLYSLDEEIEKNKNINIQKLQNGNLFDKYEIINILNINNLNNIEKYKFVTKIYNQFKKEFYKQISFYKIKNHIYKKNNLLLNAVLMQGYAIISEIIKIKNSLIHIANYKTQIKILKILKNEYHKILNNNIVLNTLVYIILHNNLIVNSNIEKINPAFCLLNDNKIIIQGNTKIINLIYSFLKRYTKTTTFEKYSLEYKNNKFIKKTNNIFERVFNAIFHKNERYINVCFNIFDDDFIDYKKFKLNYKDNLTKLIFSKVYKQKNNESAFIFYISNKANEKENNSKGNTINLVINENFTNKFEIFSDFITNLSAPFSILKI